MNNNLKQEVLEAAVQYMTTSSANTQRECYNVINAFIAGNNLSQPNTKS